MFEEFAAGQGMNLVTAAVVVAVALLAFYLIMRLIRARSNSTFVRGGRHREPRLAVLDAAAVDTRRRLVLVRRDDVEHLILIGGPTDVVIESRIAAGAGLAVSPESVSPPSRPQSQTRPSEREPAAPRPAAFPEKAAAREEIPLEKPLRRQSPAGAAPLTGTATASASSVPPGRTPATEASETGAELFDTLEAARNRVFVQPPEPPLSASGPVSPAEPTPATSLGRAQHEATALTGHPADAYVEIAADAAVRPATPAAPQPPAPQDAPTARHNQASEFEAILEAELAADLDFSRKEEKSGDLSGVTPLPRRNDRTPPRPDERTAAAQTDRDTLEKEMDRLLGDLSRRP